MQVPSNLLSKPLCVTVFVRDRVTGDTLPVIVTSTQPRPLELQAGTTVFDDGVFLNSALQSNVEPAPFTSSD